MPLHTFVDFYIFVIVHLAALRHWMRVLKHFEKIKLISKGYSVFRFIMKFHL